MSDPFQVLGVSADADEAGLRRRYLELVRQYPPEQCPEKFAEIREAYERVQDPVRRMERLIFHFDDEGTLDDVIAELRSKARSVRVPTEELLSLAER